MADDAFLKTLAQETAIQAAMLNGDPGPLISYWADCDDITVFGGWGRIEQGRQRVTDAMRWAASRFTGADAVSLEHLAVAASGIWPTRPAWNGATSASTAARGAT
jgi:hypothetical protein